MSVVWGVNDHPYSGWLEFSAIGPEKAKARQCFKRCGWNRGSVQSCAPHSV
jgi:hypothetical protein